MTNRNNEPEPQILNEGNNKPIAETINDIEMELEQEHEADIAQAEYEDAPAPIDQDVLAAGIGAAVCGLADGICESQGVSTLNGGENKALSGAIANLVPHFAPVNMDAKQVAIMALVLVTIGIATPRLAELKNKPKAANDNAKPTAANDNAKPTAANDNAPNMGIGDAGE